MTDVFISYKKEDVARVEPIARALANAGYEVWWDHRIPPGRTYRDVIGAVLQSAKCVVVVWSKLSTKAQWVLDEADEGKKRNVLLPLIIDEVDIPYGFRQIEAARLIGWRGDVHDAEWVDALTAVSHLVGRRPGGAPKPFAKPSAPPSAHPDAGSSLRTSGANMTTIILAGLLVAALLGGGYFAWRAGVFSQTQPAPREVAQTTTIAASASTPIEPPAAHRNAPARSPAAPTPSTTTEIAATTPASSSPAPPPLSGKAPAQNMLTTGAFNSTFGAMTLDANGGRYAYSNGRIRIANATANTLAGVWEQDQSSQRCSDGRYWGRFQMQFTQAGFTGSYGYCEGPTTAGPWNGSRGGGAQSGCADGYVWRHASRDDNVCVTQEQRLQARSENLTASTRTDPTGIYGPNTCITGYVWREAYAGDVVCVTSDRRAQVRRENLEAASHTN